MDPRDQEAFDRLQRKLVPLWPSIESFNNDDQTIVVVPSVDVDYPLTSTEMQAYEERDLFLVLLLRQPRARMIYVTGQSIGAGIIDYYLDLMPAAMASHARRRLFLVSPQDGSARPLTSKLLERPRVIRTIRSLIPDPDRAHMVPFGNTWPDRALAMELGIPMYGCDPRLLHMGTKSGSRRLFAEEGVPHPAGRENIRTESELIAAVSSMRLDDPGISSVVVKLDDGVGGGSNALLDLSSLPLNSDASDVEAIRGLLAGMVFELPGLNGAGFFEKLGLQGGIVEERIEGDRFASPSVQLRVTPNGKVEILSTHDQLLGGPSGLTFLGSRFPANAEYASRISEHAETIGRRLAREGVLGRFAVDFVVTRSDSGWNARAIELNLRKGGTTHPYLTLQFLTGGAYDPAAGLFTTPSGKQKFYVASDHLESDAFRTLTPDDLYDMALTTGIHFDPTRQTGAIFHMMSALPDRGRAGLTVIGDSPEEAEERYQQAVAAVHAEAAAARAGA
jgi:hypothetical protein